MFITTAFFEDEPNFIPGVAENGSVQGDVAKFIEKYERRCLVEILGKPLYDEMSAVVTPAGEITDTASDALRSLVEGKSYDVLDSGFEGSYYTDYDGVFGFGNFHYSRSESSRIWRGFKAEDDNLIADYIWYHWMFQNRTITAPTGEQVLHGENSTTYANLYKRIDRYNEFVFKVIGGRQYETSLYQFLWENSDDYPSWRPNRALTFKEKF